MAADLKRRLIAEITKPTERDKQVKVGPSSLGNPCARCLGRELAGVKVEQEFSLYPWIGTAVHAYLETQVFGDAQHELKLYTGEVPGYGPVKGTTDMYLLDNEGTPEEEGTVVDWKIVGKKKIQEYRVKGMKTQYRYQGQIYGKGCEDAGMHVDSVSIVLIPRDDGDPNNIWVYTEAYNREMAEAAFARAGAIYAIVQEDGWETDRLPSDDDCYQCKMDSW